MSRAEKTMRAVKKAARGMTKFERIQMVDMLNAQSAESFSEGDYEQAEQYKLTAQCWSMV